MLPVRAKRLCGYRGRTCELSSLLPFHLSFAISTRKHDVVETNCFLTGSCPYKGLPWLLQVCASQCSSRAEDASPDLVWWLPYGTCTTLGLPSAQHLQHLHSNMHPTLVRPIHPFACCTVHMGHTRERNWFHMWTQASAFDSYIRLSSLSHSNCTRYTSSRR